VIALAAHVVEHALEIGQPLLGQGCPRIRFRQGGALGFAIVARAVGRVDPVQLAGLKAPLPVLVLGGGNLAGADGLQDARLVGDPLPALPRRGCSPWGCLSLPVMTRATVPKTTLADSLSRELPVAKGGGDQRSKHRRTPRNCVPKDTVPFEVPHLLNHRVQRATNGTARHEV